MADADSDDFGDDIEVLPAIASGIGRVCQYWADLERRLQMLAAALYHMPADRKTLSVLGCYDLADHLKGIKIAAVARLQDRALIDVIVETIDHIDNVLRPRRNRVVHDRWKESGSWTHARRINQKPRIRRPQAFMPLEIVQSEELERVVDIYAIASEIFAYEEFVAEIVMQLLSKHRANRLTKALLAARPPRPFPRPLWETPDQTDNAV